MSVVHLLDIVSDWAQKNICDRVELKRPPGEVDEATDAGYEYELATPVAFPMYIPTNEKVQPDIRSPYPALCVAIVAGQDEMTRNAGYADVQMSLCAWDSGLHGEDILLPDGEGAFRRWSGEEADAYFKRLGEGWRDAWNFLDTARRAVESTHIIDGFTIDKTEPVKYGPISEQDSIPSLYPTWFAWVAFRVNYPIIRNDPDLQDYL